MKTDGHKPTQLEGGNLLYLEGILTRYKLQKSDFGLYLLVADMLDEIAGKLERNMYIGATKNKSAFAVYINCPEEVPGLFGVNLSELNLLAVNLL